MSGTFLVSLAGTPMYIFLGSKFFVTTEPAPTNASSPITIPGRIVAFAPILAPFLIVGPLNRAILFSVLL